MKKILSLLIIISSFCSIAQTTKIDSIQKLDEVILSDVKLKKYNAGFKVTILNDSIINRNAKSLTGLLALNSNIYFKEFGAGMLSSPSFRGTNSSQTAVIWNGININSQLNGQTDFNNEIASNYSSVVIKSGGGSVQYGSGAIGGTVHLQNDLKFTPHFENSLSTSYGSFDTKNFNYLLSTGDSKWTTSVGVSYIDSKNDYKFLGTDKTNENGEYLTLNANANLGYFISKKNILKLYHNSFLGNRNLSGTLVARSRSRYESDNFRSLLEWTHLSKNYNSKLKVAHLHEHFRFFENKNKANFSFGNVKSVIVKHDFDYNFSHSISLRSVIDYTNVRGMGSSFGAPSRDNFSTTLILKHQVGALFNYGFNIRKDITSGFKSPIVLSADARYDLSKYYSLQLNGSKNFRVPTFNDLYWQPGGNLNLNPETSYQIDLGQIVTLKPVSLLFNAYYIKTSDMIQWRPNASGNWLPINVNNAESYGTEVELKAKHKIRSHIFNLNANYSYTVSKDLDTQKQLVYVPFHKANGSIVYDYKQFSFQYQQQFNGGVFIIGRDTLPSYSISNIGLSYHINKAEKVNYQLSFNINNLFNSYYENVALRPMPNRNYQIQTTIKF